MVRGEGGFTLVECLAVLALVSLAVATVAVGIAPAPADARLREARSLFLDLDARARVIALQGEVIDITVEGTTASARAGARTIVERGLPRGAEVALLDPVSRAAMDGVRIDASGRSPDYVIAIKAGDRSAEALVAGLTGFSFDSGRIGR